MRAPAIALVLAVSSLAACGGDDPSSSCPGGKCDGLDDESAASLCAAVRGNGERIPAHFGSLARIVEHYGPLDAIAGGSSGSVTAFLYESIAMSPIVNRCGGAECDARARGGRIALLLKSVLGYLAVVNDSPEANALRELAPLIARVKAMDLDGLAATDLAAAQAALAALLASPELAGLINPELVALLETSATPEFHVRDTIAGIEKLGAFEADDVKILVRPGLINWAGFADAIGRVGSFYAGYGPFDGDAAEAWAAACAEPSRGMTFEQLAALPAGQSTCGQAFAGLVIAYRAALAAAPGPSRADDPIGQRFATLAMTSVIDGAGVEALAAARAAYLRGEEPTLSMSFADVGFGYLGGSGELAALEANAPGFTDAKSEKRVALGGPSWRTVLSLSPAEPGLARVQELDDGRLSAGGWSDLHPVQALEMLGCDEIVYVTRRGPESGFAQGVARLLGMSDADAAALYDLASASSYAGAVALADAVWCTDWNAGSSSPGPLASLAYAAPMESRSPFFTDGADPYPDASASLGLPGCTAGVP